jgi:site-specific DNA-methyltransferase (adenine-specific)
MTWRIEQADCLEFMAGLGAGSVDAVITDPPYNVGFQYNTGNDKRVDYPEWCAAWFAECKRVVGDGPIVISTGNVNVAMWCKIEIPKWILCWWKPAAMGRSPVGFCNWEPMLLYGKPTKHDGCDVIRATIKPDAALDGHPCPKPIDWGIGFVRLITTEGATVLDPFCGSGTTGVACIQTGRNFIGCDSEPKYVEIARRRCEEAAMQGRLF